MSTTVGKSTPYLRQDTAWHHHLPLLLLLSRSLHVCDCECYKVPWGVGRLLVPKCTFICLPYALEKTVFFVAFAKLAIWETYNFQNTINVWIVFSNIDSTVFSAYMETIKAFVFLRPLPLPYALIPICGRDLLVMSHLTHITHWKTKSSEHTSNDTHAKARITKVAFNAREWQ